MPSAIMTTDITVGRGRGVALQHRQPPVSERVTILITAPGEGTWAKPADWNDSDNRIDVVGSGGSSGGVGPAITGGGGAAHTYKENVDLSGLSEVPYLISPGGTPGLDGGPTWFVDEGTVLAVGGTGGANGGIGGDAALCRPAENAHSGGDGHGSGSATGGGGGAAGPDADGSTATNSTGGNAGGPRGGAGGVPGSQGSAGTTWTDSNTSATAGPGGGGGGGILTGDPGDGGQYGGGGGAGAVSDGTGGGGLMAITYRPI